MSHSLSDRRNLLGLYILDALGEPVPEPDAIEWGEWFEHANRVIAQDVLDNGLLVSTVFLAIDHNHTRRGRPILWETIIFGERPAAERVDDDRFNREALEVIRYASTQDAIDGHAIAVKMASRGILRVVNGGRVH